MMFKNKGLVTVISKDSSYFGVYNSRGFCLRRYYATDFAVIHNLTKETKYRYGWMNVRDMHEIGKV